MDEEEEEEDYEFVFNDSSKLLLEWTRDGGRARVRERVRVRPVIIAGSGGQGTAEMPGAG